VAGIIADLPQIVYHRFTCVSGNEVIGSASGVPDQTLYVPVNFFIVSGHETTVSYDNETIRVVMEYSNEIWHDAGLSFQMRSIKFMTISDERTTPPRDDLDKLRLLGKEILGLDFEDGIIDVIYIKYFSDEPSGGGRTIQNNKISSIFINEFDDQYMANWTLAHELGHTLNLGHTCGTENLMFNAEVNEINEGRSTALTQEQLLTARYFAFNAHCPDSSCIISHQS